MGLYIETSSLVGYVIPGHVFKSDLREKLAAVLRLCDVYDQLKALNNICETLCPPVESAEDDGKEDIDTDIENQPYEMYAKPMVDTELGPIKHLSDIHLFISNICPITNESGCNDNDGWVRYRTPLVVQIQQLSTIEPQIQQWLEPNVRLDAVVVNYLHIN